MTWEVLLACIAVIGFASGLTVLLVQDSRRSAWRRSWPPRRWDGRRERDGLAPP